MVKIRDVIFWVLILAAIRVAIWLVFGSPSTEEGLLIIIIVADSEILLWMSLFSIDKNVAISFAKMKHDLHNRSKDLNNKSSEINNRLGKIENLINNKI